jgi:DNA-binding HxlR family transcriptional regulator
VLSRYALTVPRNSNTRRTATLPDPSETERQATYEALKLLHERWVLFLLERLLAGVTTFNELSRSAAQGGVNTTTLSQRLSLLEREGLVTRTVHSTIPPRTSYELTPRGRATRAILDSIRHWALEYPSPNAATQADCDTEGKNADPA